MKGWNGNLLKKSLTDLGFCEKWTNWIMKCITTTSFSMIYNQETGNNFQVERGIREGNPISPHIVTIFV